MEFFKPEILSCFSVCLILYFFSQLITYVFAFLGLFYIVRFMLSKRIADVELNRTGVLITGCDSGFGYDIAKRLDNVGFTVFAGCLQEDSYGAKQLKKSCSEKMHIVPLDVTSDESIRKAVTYIQTNLPEKGLWGVVNNAGINMHGDVELLTLGLIKRVVDVNLYGPIRVTKACLPLIRQSKGRIIMVTSVLGRFAMPCRAAYNATKHGLEAVSDALRLEMTKFGVKVCIVEPGCYGHATSIHGDIQYKRLLANVDEMWAEASEEVKQIYGKEYLQSWVTAPQGGLSSPSYGNTEPVIKAMEHALVSAYSKSRYILSGTDRRVDFTVVLSILNGMVPSWMIDLYLKYRTDCHKLKR